MSVTLPVNPSTSVATLGKDYLLYVNTGTAAVPIWTLIGGQRGGSLGRSADSIDVSSKTSNGWKSALAGLRSWSVDLDGLVMLQDLGLQVLDQAFMAGSEVNIRFVYPDATFQGGWGSITDFSLDAPHDGEASLKGTIEGNGALDSRIVDAIIPLTATFSKAAPIAKVFNITPLNTLINSVEVNDVALTVTTHYTYVSATGVLTLTAAYMSGLSNGTYIVFVDIQNGGDVSVTLTVTT